MVTLVIAAINLKGGVARTTTSSFLAQALSQDHIFSNNKSILIIDLDPQSCMSRKWDLILTDSSGSSYPVPHPEISGADINYSSVCDLWMPLIKAAGWKGGGDAELDALFPLPYKTRNPKIHVVPAHELLMQYAISVPLLDRPLLGFALRQWLRSDEIKEAYSCVIIDTQSCQSPLLDAAIAAATHVYVPFIPEPQSVNAVFATISYIFSQQKNRINDLPLQILGLLPTFVTNTKLHAINLQAFRNIPTFARLLIPIQFDRSIAYSEININLKTIKELSIFQNKIISTKIKYFSLHIIRLIRDF